MDINEDTLESLAAAFKPKPVNQIPLTENTYLTSELRNVVTLFIKLGTKYSKTNTNFIILNLNLDVEASMTELTIDVVGVNRHFDSLSDEGRTVYLPRSEVEIENDKELLDVLQSSYSLIAATFHQ